MFRCYRNASPDDGSSHLGDILCAGRAGAEGGRPDLSVIASEVVKAIGRYLKSVLLSGFDGERDSTAEVVLRSITAPLWLGSVVQGAHAVHFFEGIATLAGNMADGGATPDDTPAGVETDEDSETNPDSESPFVPGGDPAGESEAALDRLCADRERARSEWISSLDDLDRNALRLTCEDPATQPVRVSMSGMDGGHDLDIYCPDGSGREVRGIAELLDRDSCGWSAAPRPGETDCEGRFGTTMGGSTGARLWIGWGDVIGILPCPPETCRGLY